MLVAGQASGHEGDHGPLEHPGVVLWKAFVLADGAAAAVAPGERALDRPSAVQHDEGGLPGESRDDLQMSRCRCADG